MTRILAIFISVLILPKTSTAQTAMFAAWNDPSPHKVQFVTVEKGVKLEVLDWGGNGQPIVLLAGLGNTAHAFDGLAPKLTRNFHVFGITRRGFGASTIAQSGYSADRLGDDVIAVLDSLKINKPVIIGHSIAGEELSSIGTRFPQRINKLIYLEAAKPYAYYDKQHGDYLLDAKTLSADLDSAKNSPYDIKLMNALEADLRILQQSLHSTKLVIQADIAARSGPSGGPTESDLASFTAMQRFVAKQLGGLLPEAELRQTFSQTTYGKVGDQKTPSFVGDSVLNGEQKYDGVKVPVLAIEAVPRNTGNKIHADPAKLKAANDLRTAEILKQINAFQAGNPSAKIIKIPNAYHYIYLSNQDEVIKAITEFIKSR
ncbi:alpha/beta fold hydrolase [Mucilaginibacter sp. MD40]|uniref:alpha/beta fold hydrolase n=1 Tax=Mucilaginibacter sp. MD40 TaxID=2029590 RepID=UPI0013042B4E|nr:alpha/beta hydrolase [Mucilaginibacter sp. MD40]